MNSDITTKILKECNSASALIIKAYCNCDIDAKLLTSLHSKIGNIANILNEELYKKVDILKNKVNDKIN